MTWPRLCSNSCWVSLPGWQGPEGMRSHLCLCSFLFWVRQKNCSCGHGFWLLCFSFPLFQSALFSEVAQAAGTRCSSQALPALIPVIPYGLLTLSQDTPMFPCTVLPAALLYSNRAGNCNVNHSSLHCNPPQHKKYVSSDSSVRY